MTGRYTLETRVLVAAPSGRDAQLAEQLLLANDIPSSQCQSMEELFKQIEQGAGTVLVASEVLTESTIERLSRVLERQPPWSDLSVIVVTGSKSGANRDSQLRELSVLTNATILERPVRSAMIVNSVKIALRARVRQYQLRDHLVERTRLEMQLADAYYKQYRIAEMLQRSLLNHPAKDRFSGIDVSTLYVAAKDEADVGGDFFDVFSIDDRRVAVVIGDVSGKGLESAARSLEMKYPLRAFMRSNDSPGAALTSLNAYLIDGQELDQQEHAGFVCICICLIDPDSRRITFSGAGMEGPVILDEYNVAQILECNNPPIGVIAQYVYGNAVYSMQDDHTLLLFTDGITESRNGAMFFGVEGVVNSIESKIRWETKDLVQTVADAAEAFSQEPNADDICIVAVRLSP